MVQEPVRFLLLLIIGMAALGCGQDTKGGDGVDLNIGPGEVRAGRLSQDQLPDDPNGLAVWEAGDFALVNEHIAVIIEDDEISDLYLPFGGSIVGVTRYEDGALVDRADYNEFAIGLRRFLVAAETVSLINDGTDGNPAVVRAEGPLRAIPFLEDVLNSPAGPTLFGTLLLGGPPPTDETFQSTRVQVDYELAPGAEHLDVFYTVDAGLPDVKPTYMIMQSKRMDPYVPGQGFGTGDLSLEYVYMAFADDDAASYAVEDVAGPMEAALAAGSSFGITDPEISGVLPLSRIEPIEFEAGKREHLMRMHVGGPGIDGLLETIARTKEEPTRTITGTVRHADGTAADGVRVHAETTDAEPVYLTRSTTKADGAYSVTVPERQEVQLVAYRRGDGISDPPVVVEASSTSADLMLPQKGAIRVTATDADSSTALPVRVQVIPVGGAFQPPDNFGEPIVPRDDRLHVVFPIDGKALLSVPPGDHRVVVSRGYEYDIVDTVVTVNAGDETPVNAQLTRVVDSTGVMCGDFHIHTHRSPDAPDAPEFKLMAAAGDGVELPVRTDHEFVAAFEPVVASLGLEAWMYGFSALELTTSSFGHFGVFPLEPDTTLQNDGAVRWNGIDDSGAVEIFDPVQVINDARSRPGAPEVIIFHPRSKPGTGGGFGELVGENYFMGFNGPLTNTGGVDYDPTTDTILRTDIDAETWWDRDFRVVEVFNDSSFAENKKNDGRIGDASNEIGTVDDWFGLLNSDERPDGMFVVGSSDSHIIMNGSPVGYPRTCVLVGTDDPSTLRADADPPQTMKNLINTGRSVINGGIYIVPTSPGKGPGDTITGAGPYQIELEVQAPLWVGDVELLEMWTSSSGTISSTPIATGVDAAIDNGSVRRFSDSVEVPDGVDWVLFHARGAYDPTIEDRNDQLQTLDPVHPGRLPFGVTNPIFFAR
ncbi:MAG: carboxypeptidase regulatory-like domain-containing protein [Deltaproteobacteria bacterium]|nr:MAG: carboxypeptidase regulatory-like domain-containing protein [Deltaproteobacteria bacterium]